jgi:glycosyltransferase involved in cell wall biosynthesis
MEKSENQILLSIGIPTYNRAGFLRSALLSLGPQVKEFENEVELIVSNNNSSDDTEEVVKWAQKFWPIRYHRNLENIGGNKNIVLIPSKLTKGRFSWVIGDDDFVRPLAVKKILEMIKKYPEIDYIYVNIDHFSTDLLEKYSQPISSSDLPNNLPLGNQDPNEYYVDNWNDLINPKISAIFLGAIMVSIVRTSIWHKYSDSLDIREFTSNFDSTYPHIKIYSLGLIGKKAYYIGKPLITVLDGVRSFDDYIPKIVLVRLHEALDIYENSGINSRQIEICRKSLVSNNRPILTYVMKNSNVKYLNSFSVTKFILKYWRYLGLKFLISNSYIYILYIFKKMSIKKSTNELDYEEGFL